MDNHTGDLPARVRQARKERRWTQKEMAERAGMSPRAYQMFETRASSPQGENLRAILRAVGMDEAGEAQAEETRESWPVETRVFLDTIGAYMDTMTKEERMEFIHDETRRLFQSRRG